jgi:SAM-dependent methyltransferase
MIYGRKKMIADSWQRLCPICSSSQRELLFAQHFESIKGVSLIDGYEVVVCGNCGLVFAGGIPSKEVFDRYYSEASKYEFSHRGGKQNDSELQRLAGLADWMATQVPLESRLLDAGCATGELLAALRARGFTCLTGLDPSESCVQYARDTHGLRMLQGVLGNKPESEQPFDVLVLSAVLEHIPDLNPFVEQLRRWLSPDGLLIVEVPDVENFAKAFNAPYQEFSVEHINFFSTSALDNLMGMHGFTRVAVRQELCYVAPNLTGPVLTMSFRWGAEPTALRRESVSEAGVRAYIEACRSRVEFETRVISELVKTQVPVLVWGVGTLCQRLLATTKLPQANIRAFIDSNPHYQGKELIGHRVISPLQLQGRSEPILISSWPFFDEIRSQIRNDLKLHNEIICIHKLP